jgi:hypothetical protein
MHRSVWGRELALGNRGECPQPDPAHSSLQRTLPKSVIVAYDNEQPGNLMAHSGSGVVTQLGGMPKYVANGTRCKVL